MLGRFKEEVQVQKKPKLTPQYTINFHKLMLTYLLNKFHTLMEHDDLKNSYQWKLVKDNSILFL